MKSLSNSVLYFFHMIFIISFTWYSLIIIIFTYETLFGNTSNQLIQKKLADMITEIAIGLQACIQV